MECLKKFKSAIKLALLAPAYIFLGCGTVHPPGARNSSRYHNHGADYLLGGRLLLGGRVTGPHVSRVLPEKYDPEIHGEIMDFVEEGQPIPGVKPVNGKRFIHRHSETTTIDGYEVRLEKWERPSWVGF